MTDRRVLEVSWLPGSDHLTGTCFCGAIGEAPDPVAMWGWLLSHPDHDPGGAADPGPSGPEPAPPAHLVHRSPRHTKSLTSA